METISCRASDYAATIDFTIALPGTSTTITRSCTGPVREATALPVLAAA